MTATVTPIAAAAPGIRPDPRIAVRHLEQFFLNRADVLATRMRWGKPAPQTVGDKLDAFLLAHVAGPAAPPVHLTYANKRGGTTAESDHYRCGAYGPAPDGTTKWLCWDFDGGADHAASLADPLAAAIATIAALKAAGVPSHLERSGGGHGWHVWVFFTAPVTAKHARAIGHAFAPKDAKLTNGELADSRSGRGIEVFPKQDRITKGKYGNLVYLPWWWDAPDGANVFYRVLADGRVEPYAPDAFETAAVETVEKLVATFTVEAPRATSVQGHDRWSAWRKAAVAALPLESVYGALLTGVVKEGGWREARDPSSPSGDQNPSAGVADGTGEAERAKFHSFRSGESLSVFDYLVAHDGAADFPAACARVAELSGVPLPTGAEARGAANADAEETTARYVLVPGQHIDSRENVHEIGNDDFAAAVLARFPAGALYRMDFVVGELVGEPGARRFVPISEQRLRAVVDQHVKLARWTFTKENGPVRTFVACSRDHAGLLLAAAGTSTEIPELRLLVHNPVYLADMTLAVPGWNEAAGVFYDEPPELANLLPNAAGAADVLRDLVTDFPFKDEASRQNVFGTMLTVVLRMAVEGRLPFVGHFAPLERSGKGKLADAAVGCAVLGRPVAPMQAGRTEEEREKRITALLLQGETVVHLDNLPVGEIVDSPALASLATSFPFWRGRMLGVSRVPLLRNNLAVILSGNNTKTTGEIAKRTVPVFLQPATDHPEERTDFVHPDIEGYAKSRRRAVLEALLGMVESWKAAGRPAAAHRRTMGGFERWAAMVGGVLAHAGLTEWMSNYRAWVGGADEWTSEAETLVERWAKDHGSAPIQAKQILALVRELGIYAVVTSRPTEESQLVALGRRVLGALTGRPVRTWQVEVVGKGGSRRYHLRTLVPPRRPEPEDAPRPEGSEGSEGSGPNLTREETPSSRQPSSIWDRGWNPSEPSDPSETVRPGTTQEPEQRAGPRPAPGEEGAPPAAAPIDLTQFEDDDFATACVDGDVLEAM